VPTTVQDFRNNTILLPRGSLSFYPSPPSSLEGKEINCKKLAFDHYSIFFMDREVDGDFASGRYEFFNLGLTGVSQNAEVMPHLHRICGCRVASGANYQYFTPHTEHMTIS
jgi:hypothetical protein